LRQEIETSGDDLAPADFEATMTQPHTLLLTALAMLPLAANSWLCRAALRDTAIDAASFTSVRLTSGAVMLWVLVWLTPKGRSDQGSWRSALALFGYAALFSFAYRSLTAATGASTSRPTWASDVHRLDAGFDSR
jgi:hypothetical protein